MTESKRIMPVAGAAKYVAHYAENGKASVWMYSTDGHKDEIQMCKTFEAADKAAQKWQHKENQAIIKSQASA